MLIHVTGAAFSYSWIEWIDVYIDKFRTLPEHSGDKKIKIIFKKWGIKIDLKKTCLAISHHSFRLDCSKWQHVSSADKITANRRWLLHSTTSPNWIHAEILKKKIFTGRINFELQFKSQLLTLIHLTRIYYIRNRAMELLLSACTPACTSPGSGKERNKRNCWQLFIETQHTHTKEKKTAINFNNQRQYRTSFVSFISSLIGEKKGKEWIENTTHFSYVYHTVSSTPKQTNKQKEPTNEIDERMTIVSESALEVPWYMGVIHG